MTEPAHRRATLSQWWSVGKPLFVPTFSAFLSFIFVVVRPLAALGGEYAFLVHTSVLLFFFPTGNLIAQLEATVLGVSASALGLAWANATLAIAAYCGRTYGVDSEPSNAIIGVGLALWSLICGFVRSYAPRFTAATRIALFFPIFLLTGNTGVVSSSYFLEQFLVTCFAAAFALIPTLIFSYGSTGPRLGKLVLGSIHATSALLPLSLSSVLDLDLAEKLAAVEANRSGKQQSLSRSLKDKTSQLRPIHDRYVLELTRSQLPPTSLQPLIKALRRINRNALLGPGSHVPGERIRAALDRTYGGASGIATPHTPRGRSVPRSQQPHGNSIEMRRAEDRVAHSMSPRPAHVFAFDRIRHERTSSLVTVSSSRPRLSVACQTLVLSVQQALRSAAAELADVYEWPDVGGTPLGKDVHILQAKEELELALAELQHKLAILLDDLGVEQRERRGRSPGHASIESQHGLERDHFRLAFYMTALLDLAKDVLVVLNVVIDLSQRATGSKRWFWPNVPGLSWLRVQTGSPPSMYERRDSVDEQDRDLDMIRQDEEDYAYEQMDFATATMYRTRQTPFQPSNAFSRIVFSWRHVWDDRRVVQGRIRVSKLLHGAKTSPHVYFAIKLAGGISLLAIPAYLSPNSRGRRWFDRYRAAWQIVSYMYVLETHTGATFQIGAFRLAGTFIGAVAAYVCTLIARGNPYALVVLATVLTVPVTYLIVMSPYPPIGVVAGITVPPLLFISYLGLANGQSDFELAWTRFVDIAIGIIGAVLAGSLVWPNHARVQYFRSVATTFDRASEYYLRMSRDLLRPSLVYQGNTKQYDRLESDVRTHVATSRTLVAIQRKEISLLPRPIKLYSEVVDATERFIETLAEIRVLRFSVPRKSTVFDIMPLRTQLISSISVNLWALNQSFKSRSPLPQHLPSPRIALEGIMASVEDLARSSRRGRDGDVGDTSPSFEGNDKLGVLYGMAENEALGEMCTILEELIAAARTLFGTRTFLGDVTYNLPQQEFV